MDAPVLYLVRFWVDPAGQRQVFDWLDGGHGAEVVSQPGFRFCQRVKLEQKSDDGWDGYFMIYGLDSRAALDNYFANKTLADKFSRERESFMHFLRMDRSWGDVVDTLTH